MSSELSDRWSSSLGEYLSFLGDEFFRRRYGLRAQIVMPGASNAHEALRRPDKTIHGLAESHGDDQIVFAVHHQDRCGDLASAQIRAKPVLHQQAHRHEPVVLRADIDGRSKRSFQHDTADRVFRCQRERERRAERFAQRISCSAG